MKVLSATIENLYDFANDIKSSNCKYVINDIDKENISIDLKLMIVGIPLVEGMINIKGLMEIQKLAIKHFACASVWIVKGNIRVVF